MDAMTVYNLLIVYFKRARQPPLNAVKLMIFITLSWCTF